MTLQLRIVSYIVVLGLGAGITYAVQTGLFSGKDTYENKIRLNQSRIDSLNVSNNILRHSKDSLQAIIDNESKKSDQLSTDIIISKSKTKSLYHEESNLKNVIIAIPDTTIGSYFSKYIISYKDSL